ncbi:MAG: hypothetical protein JWO69_743 [Thermoleophilia bacterium]|nr:hypothetical protein [Thermoleophilia bacterium]
MRISPTPVVPLFNLHVITAGHPNASGRHDVVTDTVTFGGLSPRQHGGSRITTQYVDDALQGAHVRAYSPDASERVAAQALADAIQGSGLLTQLVASTDRTRPAQGFTRIFVDRRSRVLEFETSRPPAAAQAVLDALEAYRAIALR